MFFFPTPLFLIVPLPLYKGNIPLFPTLNFTIVHCYGKCLNIFQQKSKGQFEIVLVVVLKNGILY